MSTATDMLAKYLVAEAALLEGKMARLGERTLQMEDLSEIRAGRKEWEAKVASEQASANSSPRFGGLSYSVARMD